MNLVRKLRTKKEKILFKKEARSWPKLCLTFEKIISPRDFPGGPAVKTSPSKGAGSIPGQWAKIPHVLWQKKNKI